MTGPKLVLDRDQLLMALAGHDLGHDWYLDRETGEIIPVVDGRVAEDDEALREELVEGGDRFALIEPFPSSEGFRIMADFAASVGVPAVRRGPEAALGGPNPFRRFKGALEQWPDQRQAWFAHHDRVIRAAIDRYLRQQTREAAPTLALPALEDYCRAALGPLPNEAFQVFYLNGAGRVVGDEVIGEIHRRIAPEIPRSRVKRALDGSGKEGEVASTAENRWRRYSLVD